MKFKLPLLFTLAWIVTLLFCLPGSFAQQAPQILTQTVGVGNPDPGQCNDSSLFRTYMQATDPANGFSGLFLCVQASARGFLWAPVLIAPPGTTGTRLTYTQVYNTFCGATAGNAACQNYSDAGTVRTIAGIATLSSNAAVISSISPAFTGTSTFSCTAANETTRADVVSIARTSTSSITITNTGGASDVIAYQCTGY